MIEAIGNLIRYIVILIFLATFLEMILPHGQFRRYLRMLVGILLILTIISPIQNIMRLAPGWDAPVFLAAPTGQEELALILQRGEQMREAGYKDAVENYRYHIFTVVSNILSREFSAELQELQVTLDEDPQSKEFGRIKKMVVVAREQRSDSTPEPNGPVEEIEIYVKRGGEENRLEKEKSETDTYIQPDREKEILMGNFLARYFLLHEEQVDVHFNS